MANLLLLTVLILPIVDSGLNREYPEHPPLWATTYNWENGGINCGGSCGSSSIIRELKSEYLGHVAACPVDWLGHVNTTVVTLWDGSEWWCLDAMAKEYQDWVWHPTNQWTKMVDFSYAGEFPYNQWLIDGYSLDWRPVAEFYEMFEVESER